MNFLFLLTPKANCTFIYEDFTIRQALERMEAGRFSTIPILTRDGAYVGTISEGDLLWAVKNRYMMNMRDAEGEPVQDVARRKDYQAVPVSTQTGELLKMAIDQNFVPIVDDKASFIGIVTRQKLMRYCVDEYLEQSGTEESACESSL